MPRGGRREGGGRPKGSRNRRTEQEPALMRAEAAREEMSPLDYFRMVMVDPKASLVRRDWAASQLALYLHPKPAPLPVDIVKPAQPSTVTFRLIRPPPLQIEGEVLPP